MDHSHQPFARLGQRPAARGSLTCGQAIQRGKRARPTRLQGRRTCRRHRDDRSNYRSELHLRRPCPGTSHHCFPIRSQRGSGLCGLRIRAENQRLHRCSGPRRHPQDRPRTRRQGVESRDCQGWTTKPQPRHLCDPARPAPLHRCRGHHQHHQATRLQGCLDGRLRTYEHHHPDRYRSQHSPSPVNSRGDRHQDLQGRTRRPQNPVRRCQHPRRTNFRDLWSIRLLDIRRRGLCQPCTTGLKSTRQQHNRPARKFRLARRQGSDHDRRAYELPAHPRLPNVGLGHSRTRPKT